MDILKILNWTKSLPVRGRIIAIAIVTLLLVLVLFCSCSGYRSVSLNVDKPEKVEFNMSDSITSRVHK